MVLLSPSHLAVHALEGLELTGAEQNIMRDVRKGVKDGNKEEVVAKAAKDLQNSPTRSVRSAEWLMDRGILYFRGKIYVLDTSNLRRQIVSLRHDTRIAGHAGRWKTL